MNTTCDCIEQANKRPRTSLDSCAPTTEAQRVPSFDMASDTFSPERFREAYGIFQAVHLPAILARDSKQRKGITWKDISGIFKNLDEKDSASWCVENQGQDGKKKLLPETFLKPQIFEESAYCSFLVQKDKTSYHELIKQLPLSNLSCAEDESWAYEPCIWFFFGRNYGENGDNTPALEGRGLHTDSVSHDGTWHFQLSGSKQWCISPSALLLEHWQRFLSADELAEWDENTKVPIPCSEGDVLVVNTRLWFHQTVIPSQKEPSVSYARDFRINGSGARFQGESGSEEDNDGGNMTNLDGLYARTDIDKDTIIFTEKSMPDCELHRSNDPNCQVVELEDGTSAVVSRRTIRCGEFFCVGESSDEEDLEDYESQDESS